MIVNSPRPCVNGCGTLVEWGVDRLRRVGLIESVGRFAHVCPKGLTGAHITCACGRRVHTYRHGYVEDAATGLAHECRPAQTAGARAAPLREGRTPAPPAPASGATPPAPEPPKRSLNDALGVS